MRARRLLTALLGMLLLLSAGCAPAAEGGSTCTVLLEDDPSLFFYRQVYEAPRGGDVTVRIGVPSGCRVASVNYPRYTVSAKTGYSESWDYYDLILHAVRYPAVIRIAAAPQRTTVYHLVDGDVTVAEDGPHLRPNTLPYREEYAREGFLAVGWSTSPDGSGTHIGFGSRTDHDVPVLELYPHYLPCAPAEGFRYVERDGGAVIVGYSGDGPDLILPEALGGLPVTAIAAGAFGDVDVGTLALPPALKTVEDGAFRSLTAEDLYLFDGLEEVGEGSFGGYSVRTLHINAVKDPVYSGTWFDTFPDKADRLRALGDADKLVLFCGSSARFGYDSPALEAAFPQYQVVNMGVYAYSNILPQAHIVLALMKAGDVLLSSPELDAIPEQFCGEAALDRELFAMTESDYDLLALPDCRAFTNVFGAFGDYQAARKKLPPLSYDLSPSQFDEDGSRVETPSYNAWGDYILYRENNAAGTCFGVKRAYYNAAHIRQQDLDGLNGVYDAFSAKGIRVLFTYSPRMRTSVSEDSGPEETAALDALLRRELHAPAISEIGSSLMDPLYFYATDNHLSTEGVRIYTARIVEDLRPFLEVTP